MSQVCFRRVIGSWEKLLDSLVGDNRLGSLTTISAASDAHDGWIVLTVVC
jgi:hypothetical protein